MPRVSVAHEQAVRQRIIDAAVKVFGDTAYERATMQDVVRESGLSVGALYTHFKSKDELFLAACSCAVEAQKLDLRLRLADVGSVADRLRAAIDFAVEMAVVAASDRSVTVHTWTAAESSPVLRQMLRDRRIEMAAFARLILQEAVARGELPSWIDVDVMASAWVTLFDGFVMRAAEDGGMSVEQARKEAHSLLELLIAAPHDRPAAVDALRSSDGRVPA